MFDTRPVECSIQSVVDDFFDQLRLIFDQLCLIFDQLCVIFNQLYV